MSSSYAGNPNNFPANITVLDDGDNADANGIGAPAFEGLADRTMWNRRAALRGARFHSLGAMPFVSNAGNFSVGAGDYNYMGVHTSTTEGDSAKWSLQDVLADGETLASIDVIFIPTSSGRTPGTLPGTAPTISLVRWSMVVGDPPSIIDVVATEVYSPVSAADYVAVEFKQVTLSTSHVVDGSYVYQLVIADEDGSDAVPGNTYFAFRVSYA